MNCVIKIENPTTEVQAKVIRMITGHHPFRLSCNDQENAYHLARQGLPRIGVSPANLQGLKKTRRDLNGILIGIPTKKIDLIFTPRINSLQSQFNLPRLI